MLSHPSLHLSMSQVVWCQEGVGWGMDMCAGHSEKRLIQNGSRLDHLQLGQGRRHRMCACVEGILTMVRIRSKLRAIQSEKDLGLKG